MAFASINYLAVVIAAIAGFGVGAIWYSFLFARPWMNAVGMTEAEIRERRSATPFVIALFAYLVMAWVLALFIGSIYAGANMLTVGGGMVVGALAWLGFAATTTMVNYAFAARRQSLTAIDAGHWLAVAIVMGAIEGAFG